MKPWLKLKICSFFHQKIGVFTIFLFINWLVTASRECTWFILAFNVLFLTFGRILWRLLALKRSNMVILAPILAPSFFKFWKRYPEIFTFFYVRAEHHWKKARARWAAFGTELANTADPDVYFCDVWWKLNLDDTFQTCCMYVAQQINNWEFWHNVQFVNIFSVFRNLSVCLESSPCVGEVPFYSLTTPRMTAHTTCMITNGPRMTADELGWTRMNSWWIIFFIWFIGVLARSEHFCKKSPEKKNS